MTVMPKLGSDQGQWLHRRSLCDRNSQPPLVAELGDRNLTVELRHESLDRLGRLETVLQDMTGRLTQLQEQHGAMAATLSELRDFLSRSEPSRTGIRRKKSPKSWGSSPTPCANGAATCGSTPGSGRPAAATPRNGKSPTRNWNGSRATAYFPFPPNTESMAFRCWSGKRCRYRFRISSVWCPIHSSISRWSILAAARLEAKECRKV